MDMIPGPKSIQLFERATACIPGGVNSPVRAFRAVGKTPFLIKSARGAYVEDEDGNQLLDFVGSWGPLVLGHGHPKVAEAIRQAVDRGTTFGALCRSEIELAERVVASYPGLEQVRFVSSGTEATMSAIRLARGATGRDLIVKFSGCYHGHADHLLVSAGSGLVTFGRPSSAGVPAAFTEKTLVLPLDDEQRARDLFSELGPQIAALIIEPMPANNGLLLQRPEFLQTLRDLTREYGSVLIFDEVMTGFRVAWGGAQQYYGVTPDLTTLGKVIGGGLPVGAFGGPRSVMSHLAPEGPVYQAGTLSGNPVAMAAGLAALETLAEENGWERLEALGASLEALVTPVLEARDWPCRLVRLGSVFWFSPGSGEPARSAETIDSRAAEQYTPLFQGLLERGISLAPSAYEVGFLSLAHEQTHLEQFAQALSEFLEGSRIS